nr:type II toxin-antitoxin system RelE/ParE family toxin [Brevundimonas sp.]
MTFGLQAADRYSAGLKAAMARLADFPRLAQERSDLSRPVRVLPYGSHIVVYATENDSVHVLRIRHASEDWHGDPVGESSGDQP